MNLNQLFNVIGNMQNSTSNKSSTKNSTEEFPPLYPSIHNVTSEGQNHQSGQDFKPQQNLANPQGFSSLMQLFSLFSSKKQDLPSLLTSSAVKSLGVNENMLPLLSMLSNKKGKVKAQGNKSTLPKIDSFSRVE